MSQSQINQWRTVLLVFAGMVILFASFRLSFSEPGAKDLYAILRDGIVLLVGIAAGKALGQHLAGGGGVQGALSALFTSAKPEPKPKPPPADKEPKP